MPVTLLAQDEEWDVYMAQYEKGVGSTMINMSAKSYAPHKKFPFILITGVTFKGCDSIGMPTMEQFPVLYTISDSVRSLLNKTVDNIMVATFTHQCERLDYYYVSDSLGLSKRMVQMYSKYFKDHIPYFNIREDKLWQGYLNFLYPNDETFEFIKNQKVVLKLVESGDKLEQPRQIDHWIYFTTEPDRNCYIDYATNLGFKTESAEKTTDQMRPFKLQISRIDKVDVVSISKLTLEMRKEAIKCKGVYDGWETFVIK